MRRPAELVVGAIVLGMISTACFSQAEPGDITVYGPYVGREADVFSEVVESFEDQTGIDVRYTGTASFVSEYRDRLDNGDLPDIILVPQPGLIEPLDGEDLLVPMSPELGDQAMDAVGSVWQGIMEIDGGVVAVPYRFVVKSLVWYRSDVFEENGYEIPTTLDELAELSDQIEDDGIAPWCAGMDDYSSTGWWGTDWVEDIVLRRAGAETYLSWATLETPFDDPAIVAALDEVDGLLGSPGAVAGGRSTILNTLVPDAISPMFADPPGCLMHRQASFQTVWLPDGVSYGDGQLDAFALPSVDGGPPPMTISGEIAVSTSDDPGVSEFMLHLVSAEGAAPWRTIGGSLVARADRDEDIELDPLDDWLVGLLDAAPSSMFDASDIMPQEIGSDAFWVGMIELFSGRPADEVATDIQSRVDAIESDATSD